MASKGTAAKGKKAKKRFAIRCRRCGKAAYHIRHKVCASCGYGRSSKIRKYSWQKKKRSKRSYGTK